MTSGWRVDDRHAKGPAEIDAVGIFDAMRSPARLLLLTCVVALVATGCNRDSAEETTTTLGDVTTTAIETATSSSTSEATTPPSTTTTTVAATSSSTPSAISSPDRGGDQTR